MKFAKLYDLGTDDNGDAVQVLVTLGTNDDGDPCVTMRTDVGGIDALVHVTHPDKGDEEAQWALVESEFKKFTEELARTYRASAEEIVRE